MSKVRRPNKGIAFLPKNQATYHKVLKILRLSGLQVGDPPYMAISRYDPKFPYIVWDHSFSFINVSQTANGRILAKTPLEFLKHFNIVPGDENRLTP